MTVAAATAAPFLLAFNQPPSPTLLNQCLSVAGAGVWLALLPKRQPSALGLRDDSAAITVVVALALAVIVAFAAGLPLTIGFDHLAILFTCGLTLFAAAHLADDEATVAAFKAFAAGLLVAGLASSVISCAQVFTPDLIGGDVIARSTTPGRAVGNLRQPNHLSSLLMWSLIGAVALYELRALRRVALWSMVVGLMLALVLTGSRTGALGLVVLTLWGLVDRRLSAPSRRLLVWTLPLFAVIWAAVWAWAHATSHAFAAASRLAATGGDISSSRFAIWSNALTMLKAEWATGVGYGEFNIAWTLWQLPDRPVAFFDHTHNLLLQLLIELGLPLGAALIALLAWALVGAWRRSSRQDGEIGCVRRAALLIVLTIGLHSMLEYPLWYAYFLLPTAFAFGLAQAPANNVLMKVASGVRQPQPLVWAGLGATLAMGAAAATLDYQRIAVIYDPPDEATPLEERILRGQRSPLFGHHADYAAATAFGPPQAPLTPSQRLAFERAPHQLLDIRLMIAWSQALAAQGEVDKARWLAARIREFRNPAADEYFEPCAKPAEAANAFQCQAPERVYRWREFVSR